MGLFTKKKTDPAYQGAQQAAQVVMQGIANTKLPALPSFTADQQAQMTPAVNVPSSLPSYLGGGAGTVFPAGMPNQLSMIAQQLGAGGYGAPADIAAQLSGIYKPQVVAPQPPPVPQAPAAPAAPAAPVAPAAAAAPVAPAAPTVQRPMGFTGASQATPIPSTSSSLYGGPMIPNFSDFLRFLQNPTGYSNINKR